MQQRLVAAAEQEERQREQRRIVRERQQALQLSREMAEQHRKIEERQQREQQVRSRNAEDLLAKADRFAAKGQFDQALELLAQAQAINPPQLDRIALMREQLIATKTQREREQQTAELDGMFRRAKTAFDAGRYEESVALFEQVIAHEAALGRPSSVSATAATAMRGAVLQ
jgi:tetratricopeptide (TPR) repeat protein